MNPVDGVKHFVTDERVISLLFSLPWCARLKRVSNSLPPSGIPAFYHEWLINRIKEGFVPDKQKVMQAV